ncbi:MAG TPA: NUDIX hydrolase [Thermoleophilaceae bacterium]|nr:NUDIX hydrolase [Thermoleophilaceae bacterium]
MRVDRPPPGEELNPGEVTKAREAACVILLRDGDAGPEVLLVQRNPEQRFMGGAWVFPGGAVHAEDGGFQGSALRELEEEAGVRLPEGAELVPFSRWITPEEVKVRFDTWFFLAAAPAGVQAKADGAECVDARWLRAQDALAAYSRDELMLVFPTIKHLEQLAELDSVGQALELARGREVHAIQPRVVVRDGAAEVLLPGEPGYE